MMSPCLSAIITFVMLTQWSEMWTTLPIATIFPLWNIVTVLLFHSIVMMIMETSARIDFSSVWVLQKHPAATMLLSYQRAVYLAKNPPDEFSSGLSMFSKGCSWKKSFQLLPFKSTCDLIVKERAILSWIGTLVNRREYQQNKNDHLCRRIVMFHIETALCAVIRIRGGRCNSGRCHQRHLDRQHCLVGNEGSLACLVTCASVSFSAWPDCQLFSSAYLTFRFSLRMDQVNSSEW